MDDAAGVLTGVRNGDAQVFGDLYLAHARQVYSFCGRRTGNWIGAEDLTSIVFLEAWRTRERAFLVEGSLRAWLFGIAAHVISTSERSGRRHRAALRRFAGRRDLDDWGQDDGTVQAVLQQADRDQAAVLVRSAVDRLPPAQGEAVVLCLLGGLTQIEAATVLNVPVSTVRSRVHDGRVSLHRLLQARDLDPPDWLSGHQEVERRPGAPAEAKEVGTP
jgi:RNA polymerase sigma factor (sigma-70 family)